MGSDESLPALREALRLSPENLPLRQHLATSLLNLGRPEEAEHEYRQALALSPDDQNLKIGLASAFYQQGKVRHALVLTESLFRVDGVSPRAYLLHARLLLRSGNSQQAARQYRAAVELDPAMADAHLAQRLNFADMMPARDANGDELGKIMTALEPMGTARDPLDLPAHPVEHPALTLDAVAGMAAVRDALRMNVVNSYRHPEMYRAYGRPVGGAVLLYGPPGCGKAFLARAVSGELGASLLAVGLDDVFELRIGNCLRNFRELFRQAREHRPCVVYFDGLESLGASSVDELPATRRRTLSQFLSALDEARSETKDVVVLAGTDAPWRLESALFRPGRFERSVFVPPPDATAREAIARQLCHDLPVGEIDLPAISARSDGYSVADLKRAFSLAAEQKLREALQVGAAVPIMTKDLLAALALVKPSTRDWFAAAANSDFALEYASASLAQMPA